MEASLSDANSSNFSCTATDRIALPLPAQLVLVFAYVSVGVFSLLGNLLVLSVLVLRRQTRTVTNIFISSVSAADLVITVFSLWATPLAYFLGRWTLGKIMCYAVYAIQGASLMWAPFTLAAIAIDRYMLVASPYKQQMSPRTSLLVVIGIWSGAFLVLTPMLEHVEYIEVGPCHQFCLEFWHPNNELRLVYGIVVLTIRSFVPLVVISFCHWRIASILNAHGKKLKTRRSSSEASSAADIKRKQRLQKLLLSMVLIFAVSSFPLDLFNIHQDLGVVYKVSLVSEEAAGLIFFCSHWVAMAGCLLNPLVYAWNNDNFRIHIKSLFSKEREGFRTVLLLSTRDPPRDPHANTTSLIDAAGQKDSRL